MLTCAYCDMSCQQTREHVVPDWYCNTPGDSETFNAQAPLTHVQGALIVKDVCESCNGGPLSKLDDYGKGLYERYFASPVYAGETISFDYDGDRLLRWLLKLSYNSARAQNADVRVLSGYRKVMLGESPLPDRIRCWLHLIAATRFDPQAKIARPALRDEQGRPDVQEPLWFRIGQCRLPSCPTLSLVQRTVLINSFAFTLLIGPTGADWSSTDFDRWITVFVSAYPEAKPIPPAVGSLTVTAGDDHAAASIYPLFASYPSRFSDEPNPFVRHILTAGVGVIMLRVPRELIEVGDTTIVASALHHMVSTRENAAAFRQRVGVMVDGFNDDSRRLSQFPKVRDFFRRLFIECPFVMFLAHPDGSLLRLFAACWSHEDTLTEEGQRQRMSEFLTRAFTGLNTLNHTLALSEEQNRDICMTAIRVLFDETPQCE